MLKTLAIFAMLFVVAHACFPAPREISNPKTDSSKNKAQDAGRQQSAPVSTPAIPQPTYSPTFNYYTQKEGTKDGWDKAAVFSNYLLVIIGIGGVVVAIITICFIKRQVVEMRRQRVLTEKTLVAINVQAGHMESQTKILQDSVAVAKKSADSAEKSLVLMKSKERARLTVKIPPVRFPVTDMFWGIAFQVGNIGPSDAFNIAIMARLEFTTSHVSPKIPSPHGIRYFPRIRAGKRVRFVTGPNDWDGSAKAGFDGWDEGRMASVASGKTFMHLRGTVDYEDVFGDPHVTPFRYMWHPSRFVWVEAVNNIEDPKAT
jgi:hypothetical protein